METAELLVSIFSYPLWFAKLLAEHFPPNFTITEEMEENWRQTLNDYLSQAREKIRDNSSLAGFLEPCLLDNQLLEFAQSAGQHEPDLVLIHTFFCSKCGGKYSRLICEEVILGGLQSIQNGQCPENNIIFGHFNFMMKNPEAAQAQEPVYRRIQQFGYPEFMLLVMDHLNHCYRCRESFTELQKASEEAEKDDRIIDQIEEQLKDPPSN